MLPPVILMHRLKSSHSESHSGWLVNFLNSYEFPWNFLRNHGFMILFLLPGSLGPGEAGVPGRSYPPGSLEGPGAKPLTGCIAAPGLGSGFGFWLRLAWLDVGLGFRLDFGWLRFRLDFDFDFDLGLGFGLDFDWILILIRFWLDFGLISI